MYCNEHKSVNTGRNVPKKKNKKRKKKSTHLQNDTKVRYSKLSPLNIAKAMSTWAQNYTTASTWQLKHQVAYWKSRASALQYENKLLHELIRERCFKQSATDADSDSSKSGEETEAEIDEVGAKNIVEKPENGEAECEDTNYEEHKESVDDDNEDFEVSEEFIEFLKQNAKYKESARKEKAQLKAKEKAEKLQTLEHEKMLESSEVKLATLKDLYGANWEKIMALETSTLCDFITESDRHQPEYWPNIPFNL